MNRTKNNPNSMNLKLLKEIDFFRASIGTSFLIIAFSVAYFMVMVLPSQHTSVKSAQYSKSMTEKPTSTPQPTAIPTLVPIKPLINEQQVVNALDCNKITGNLTDKYQNIYTVDDILIKDYRECHYKLLRDNGHEVNDNNIRDQLQP